MEALGQYADAADMFYYAVQAKRTNVEALAGLKRCGQMTLSKNYRNLIKPIMIVKIKRLCIFIKMQKHIMKN